MVILCLYCVCLYLAGWPPVAPVSTRLVTAPVSSRQSGFLVWVEAKCCRLPKLGGSELEMGSLRVSSPLISSTSVGKSCVETLRLWLLSLTCVEKNKVTCLGCTIAFVSPFYHNTTSCSHTRSFTHFSFLCHCNFLLCYTFILMYVSLFGVKCLLLTTHVHFIQLHLLLFTLLLLDTVCDTTHKGTNKVPLILFFIFI